LFFFAGTIILIEVAALSAFNPGVGSGASSYLPTTNTTAAAADPFHELKSFGSALIVISVILLILDAIYIYFLSKKTTVNICIPKTDEDLFSMLLYTPEDAKRLRDFILEEKAKTRQKLIKLQTA